MATGSNLRLMAKVISWIDQYRGDDFKAPSEIEEAVKTINLKPFKRGWEKVRSVIEEIYEKQGSSANNLRRAKLIRDITIIGFLLLSTTIITLKAETLYPIIFNPTVMIIIVLIMFAYLFIRYKLKTTIKTNKNAYKDDLEKVRSEVQSLIYYFCDRILVENKKPDIYNMDLFFYDYYGISVLGRKGFFGAKYYNTLPSVIDAIASKTSKYIKVIEPWAEERALYESLLRIDPKIDKKVLIPKKKLEEKKFKNFWKKNEERLRRIKILMNDIDKIDQRIVLTNFKTWQTKNKDWHTLNEVKNSMKRKQLEMTFDKIWKTAKPITIG